MNVNLPDATALHGMQASSGAEHQVPPRSEMAGALESARHCPVVTSFESSLEEFAAKCKAAFPASELKEMHAIVRRVHVDARAYKVQHDNPPTIDYNFTQKDWDELRTAYWNNFKIARVDAEKNIGNTRDTYFPGFSIASVSKWISTELDLVPSFDRLYVEDDVYAFTRDAFVGNALPL